MSSLERFIPFAHFRPMDEWLDPLEIPLVFNFFALNIVKYDEGFKPAVPSWSATTAIVLILLTIGHYFFKISFKLGINTF